MNHENIIFNKSKWFNDEWKYNIKMQHYVIMSVNNKVTVL